MRSICQSNSLICYNQVMGDNINFATIGLTEQDVFLEHRRLPGGGMTVTAVFTKAGNQIFLEAAARYGMTPDDFLQFILRSSIGLPDLSQDP